MDAKYSVVLRHQKTGEVLDMPSREYLNLEYIKRVNARGWFTLTLPGGWSLGLEKEFTDWRVMVHREAFGR